MSKEEKSKVDFFGTYQNCSKNAFVSNRISCINAESVEITDNIPCSLNLTVDIFKWNPTLNFVLFFTLKKNVLESNLEGL